MEALSQMVEAMSEEIFQKSSSPITHRNPAASLLAQIDWRFHPRQEHQRGASVAEMLPRYVRRFARHAGAVVPHGQNSSDASRDTYVPRPLAKMRKLLRQADSEEDQTC